MSIRKIILIALPASGKSECRKFLKSEEFRPPQIKPNTQLDDYPYVSFMNQIDAICVGLGCDQVFFSAETKTFKNGYEWGMLIHLLNEDYINLINKTPVKPAHAGEWLLRRYDTAGEKVGMAPRFGPHPKFKEIADAIKDKAQDHIVALSKDYPATDIEDYTLIIECARGGREGSEMPLKDPYGYQYSLAQLSDELLDGATILYIWVTPEQSFNKNRARGVQGTEYKETKKEGVTGFQTTLSLFHAVPDIVMKTEYGCDDIRHITKDGYAHIMARGKERKIPITFLDNREDLTTFARKPESEWGTEEKAKLSKAITACCKELDDLQKGLKK
jgi:hypothetical protein